MKKFYYLAAIALMASCSANEDVAEQLAEPVPAKVTAAMQGNESATRALNNQWAPNAAIGITVLDASGTMTKYKNVKYVSASGSEATSVDFQASSDKGTGIYFEDVANHSFAAYAPYQETAAYSELPGTNGLVNVNTRDGNTSDKIESIDYLFAPAISTMFSSPNISFTGDNAFAHKMAKLTLKIKMGSGFTASQISDITSVSLNGLIHEGTFNVTTGGTALTGFATNWVLAQAVFTDEPSTGIRTYTLILLPQDCSSTPLVLDIGHSGLTFRNNSDLAPTLEASKAYSYTITMNKTGLVVEQNTITPWVDEPEKTGDAGVVVPTP